MRNWDRGRCVEQMNIADIGEPRASAIGLEIVGSVLKLEVMSEGTDVRRSAYEGWVACGNVFLAVDRKSVV